MLSPYIKKLQGLWLIGALFRAGKTTYAGALGEFTYLFLWSVLPFFLGALTLYAGSDSADKSLYVFALSTFRNGELLVFTISMLAPILYMTLHDPEQAAPFPHKLPVSTAVIAIVVTSAALFALMKAHAVKDTGFVFSLSVWLTFGALLFRYLAIVYHRLRLPQLTERDLRSDQNGFVQDYKDHLQQEHSHGAGDFTQGFAKHLEAQK